jgi:hypothetical protein
MASFVLVPGAGGMSWYWHRAVPLIRGAGHEPIAVDLPGDDNRAGLATYADIVHRAIAERSDVILVAQSLAGFTAPLVSARASVRMIVFVNAMIPKPGETAGAWWGATAAVEAREQGAARRGAAMRRNSMWKPTFCTTCRRTCCATVRNSLVRKPRPFSESPVASSAGRTSPFMSLREKMIAFSRSNFNGVSRAKGLAGRWKKSPAAISSHCRTRKD